MSLLRLQEEEQREAGGDQAANSVQNPNPPGTVTMQNQPVDTVQKPVMMSVQDQDQSDAFVAKPFTPAMQQEPVNDEEEEEEL